LKTLIDQIIRASRSVTANIAEGYGRYHYREFAQFYRQGRGSLYEMIDHLIVACDEGYISNEELNRLKREIQECLAILNGFINYLLKAKSNENVGRVEEDVVHYQLAENDY
jgi:four helix bundle protein